jgi:hypothetical protein
MQDSSLIAALRKLSLAERRQFGQLVRSPFFQKRPEIERFFDYLDKNLSRETDRPDRFLEKETAWKAVESTKSFDEKQLRYWMSWLLDALREWLVQVELEADAAQRQLYLMHALRRRGMDDLFEKEVQKTTQLLDNQRIKDAKYHFHRYRIAHENLEKLSLNRRGSGIELQPLNDELSIFFASETLRQACVAATHEATSGHTTVVGGLAETLRTVEAKNWLRFPAVGIYFHAFRALSEADLEAAGASFFILKKEIETHWQAFSTAEMRGIYLLSINFCIRRLNRGAREFIREAFDLYRSALERGVLLESGQLSTFTYKNILRLAVALGETGWAETFLADFKRFLPARERENSWRYNLAFLYFQQKNYAAAMPLLRQTELDDVLNNLDARRMLLRTFVELGEAKALESHLISFEMFLRRQKDLGYGRENYLKLIQFIRKWQSLPPENKVARARLRKQIEAATNVAERGWLLEKV